MSDLLKLVDKGRCAMKKVLVISAALALVGIARAQKLTLPNGNTIETLPNGETWATIYLQGKALAIQLTPNMPATGQFQTNLVQNLPESDIVGAPQSVEIQIWGDCQTKTYQIMGMLPYEGKMRGGLPETENATGPEGSPDM